MADTFEKRVSDLEWQIWIAKWLVGSLVAGVCAYFGLNHFFLIPREVQKQLDEEFKGQIREQIVNLEDEFSRLGNAKNVAAEQLKNQVVTSLPIVVTGKVNRKDKSVIGSPNVTMNPGQVGETIVNFKPNTFAEAPMVVVMPLVASYNRSYVASVYNVSEKGFSVCTVEMGNHPTDEVETFYFVAIQPQ
ncbi:MAG TPA: hypothetical protein VMJ32_09505 [Pirellulales bacterium]|nr:hypothetical protein [Pirellulales bacterium]